MRPARAVVARIATSRGRPQQLLRDVAVLADLSGVGVVRLDDDSRVDFANLTAHPASIGRSGTMLGQTAIEAFIDRRIEEIARAGPESGFASGETLSFDRTARRSPCGRGVRRRAAYGSIIEDVSELRRLQRIRAEFIENLSHELRTPLSTVSLLTETLAREADQTTSRRAPRCAIGSQRSRWRPATSSRWSTSCSTSRASSRGPDPARRRRRSGSCRAASAERLRLFAERQGVELRVEVPRAFRRFEATRIGWARSS